MNLCVLNYLSTRNETGGLINVEALISTLNWRDTPVSAPKLAETSSVEDNKLLETTTLERQNLRINYEALLKDLSGGSTA